MKIEHCKLCDNETGTAGLGDGSLYINTHGPYCECCFDEIEKVSRAAQIEALDEVKLQMTTHNFTPNQLLIALEAKLSTLRAEAAK